MTEKILVFDMDGTIADLYGFDNWLEKLRESNPQPYLEANPIYDMDVLNGVLASLKEYGWSVVVTSWLSKESTKEFSKATREAKMDWLDKYDFPYDEVHLVKYGTTKADCTRKYKGTQILIDDNEKVRAGWSLGFSFDANNNVVDFLTELLDSENRVAYNRNRGQAKAYPFWLRAKGRRAQFSEYLLSCQNFPII